MRYHYATKPTVSLSRLLWIYSQLLSYYLSLVVEACWNLPHVRKGKGVAKGAPSPIPQTRRSTRHKHMFEVPIWTADSQEKNWNCCHQISYFELQCTKFSFGWGHSAHAHDPAGF